MDLGFLMPYMPVLSFVVSVGAFIMSGLALRNSALANRRSAFYQEYEYAPRVQVEQTEMSHKFRDDGAEVTCSAVLANKGTKPVWVDRVSLSYGSEVDAQKRLERVMTSGFYLSPGEETKVRGLLYPGETDKVQEQFGLDHCAFFLHIRYKKPNGDLVEEAPRFMGQHGAPPQDAGHWLPSQGAD